MADLTDNLGTVALHALKARDCAHVAYWVPRDGRDYHIQDLLMHAALMADAVSAIRAARPDLAFKADAEAIRYRGRAAAADEKARAHG